MSELKVPKRSIEGVGMLACENLPNAEEWARAIATPVVAARLRYWAEYLPEHLRWMLLDDADKLDGGAS